MPIDRASRKQEIKVAFWQTMPLPGKADEALYEALLARIGVRSAQDTSILLTVVTDAIMEARRGGIATMPMDLFRDWLVARLLGA